MTTHRRLRPESGQTGSPEAVLAVAAILVLAIVAPGPAAHATAGAPGWTHQFGTAQDDLAEGVAVYGAAVYVAGSTNGTLPGQTSAGGTDAFLRRYDEAGSLVWTRQFGTAGDDVGVAIAAGPAGVFVVGHTTGTFPGETGGGNHDVYMRAFDTDGAPRWTRQLGTVDKDLSSSVALVSDGVYLAGYTWGEFPGETAKGGMDGFVMRLGVDGESQWIRQFGRSGSVFRTSARHIAADDGAVYIGGYSEEMSWDEGIIDGFVMRFDSDGTQQWVTWLSGHPRPWLVVSGLTIHGSVLYIVVSGGEVLRVATADGASESVFEIQDIDATDIAVDDHGIYLSGVTWRDLETGTLLPEPEPCLARYGFDGDPLWRRRFAAGVDGSLRSREVGELAVTPEAVFTVGFTDGALPGQASAGGEDAWLRRYPAERRSLAIVVQGLRAGWDCDDGDPGSGALPRRLYDAVRADPRVAAAHPILDLAVFSYRDPDDPAAYCDEAKTIADYRRAETCEPLWTYSERFRRWYEEVSLFADDGFVWAHSTGGNVVLDALARWPDDLRRLRSVVTLDTPMQGLQASDALDEADPCPPDTGRNFDVLPASRITASINGLDPETRLLVTTVRNSRDSLVPPDAAFMIGVQRDVEVRCIGGYLDHMCVYRAGRGAVAHAVLTAGGPPEWPAEWSDSVTCLGLPATILGTPGDDVIQGTSGPDVIIAYAGDDVVLARGGSDRICAGNGADLARGALGPDWINGGRGTDRIEGFSGVDTLFGGPGHDTVHGGTQHDLIHGNTRNDTMYGPAGNDVLIGDLGDDTADGGPGIADRCDAEHEVRCELDP